MAPTAVTVLRATTTPKVVTLGHVVSTLRNAHALNKEVGYKRNFIHINVFLMSMFVGCMILCKKIQISCNLSLKTYIDVHL